MLALPTGLAAQDTPHTILWEVSKPGINHKSYLFGTFHEVNATYFTELPNTLQKLNNASVLFIELSTADAATTAVQPDALLSWNMLRWNRLMNKSQQDIFQSFVEKTTDTNYYKMPPLMLTLALFRLYAQNFCDTVFRASNELMDMHIEKLALASGKPVFSLDSSHNSLLFAAAGGNSKDSGYAITCTEFMQKMLQGDASGCTLINDYKNFDIDYAFQQSLQGDDALAVVQRNNRWINILNNVFPGNSCFVAVGFRHLMYRQGIIQQLQQLGYMVTPISTR